MRRLSEERRAREAAEKEVVKLRGLLMAAQRGGSGGGGGGLGGFEPAPSDTSIRSFATARR